MSDQALALVQFYRRRIPTPWADAPVELQVLVEGLMCHGAVLEFDTVFDGVSTAEGWLALQPLDRLRRVAPLGMGRQKLAHVDRLAVALLARNPGLLDPARYVDAMALLRWGHYGEPVDPNVVRVVGRMLPRVPPEVWVADLVWKLRPGAGPGPVEPPAAPPVAYQAVSAVLDVGASLCPARGAMGCGSCPLRPGCATGRAAPSRLRLA